MKKRLFVALNLPKAFKTDLNNYLQNDNLVKLLADFSPSFVSEKNLHITVTFLDTVDEKLIPKLIEILQTTCLTINPFNLQFINVILAPPGRFPRMIWAVFDKNFTYSNLMKKINESVVSYFKNNKHPIFIKSHQDPIPHITLVRFKNLIKNLDLPEMEIKNKDPKFIEAVLKHSQLSPKGPTYIHLADLPFRSG